LKLSLLHFDSVGVRVDKWLSGVMLNLSYNAYWSSLLTAPGPSEHEHRAVAPDSIGSAIPRRVRRC